MRRIISHGPRQLFLDVLFITWLGYAAMSGHIVPPAVANLLHNDPPAVVITDFEPVIGDDVDDHVDPDDSDYSTGRSFPQPL